MYSVHKLIAFIFLVYVVQSRESEEIIKSFKLNENMIYDCVDIYKQPSLSHPLLQNHQIQMEPSFSISKPKNKVKSKSENEDPNIIECPNGTVPILRNSKEYVANASYWSKKHLNPLMKENPGWHVAGIRSTDKAPYHGVGAWMSVHDLNVSKEQVSHTSIFVGTGFNNDVNFIGTGWMVNPRDFGDGRTWSFGVWKGANGAGCFNTICPGFIQVSKNIPINVPFPPQGKGEGDISVTILLDKKTRNWWTTHVDIFEKHIPIGYWQKELFDKIKYDADNVGVMGATRASPSGVSPPMGNGQFPNKDDSKCASVAKVFFVDSDFKTLLAEKLKLEKLLDSNQCYGLRGPKKGFFPTTNLFTYGGPGGESCGI
ncbi:unnamed protein product [Cochlearia groenlandica]